jgi:DNA-binding NarL/FixJ family response regulator
MKEKAHKNIFIIGRDEVFTQLLDYIFTKHIKYRFLDFCSGEDCLEKLSLKPDLVIIDYSLPGINGYDTLLQVKDDCPDCDVVVLVDPTFKKMPAELLKAGASDYIIKSETLIADIILKMDYYLPRKKVVADEQEKLVEKQRIHPVLKVVGYTILFLILISAGLYYYQ